MLMSVIFSEVGNFSFSRIISIIFDMEEKHSSVSQKIIFSNEAFSPKQIVFPDEIRTK